MPNSLTYQLKSSQRYNPNSNTVSDNTGYISADKGYQLDGYNGLVFNPQNLHNSGLTLAGWTTRQGYDIVHSVDYAGGAVNLFPVWKPSVPYTAAYTIKFRTNISGFFGSLPPDITVQYGTELDLNMYWTGQMLRTGYVFLGWSVSQYGQTVYPRLTVVKSFTLYAVWGHVDSGRGVIKDWDVIFHDRGFYTGGEVHYGDSGDVPASLVLGHSSTLRLAGYNPNYLADSSGRQFLGWTDEPEGTAAKFEVNVLSNKHLFSVWEGENRTGALPEFSGECEPPSFTFDVRYHKNPPFVPVSKDKYTLSKYNGRVEAVLKDGRYIQTKRFPDVLRDMFRYDGEDGLLHLPVPLIPETAFIELLVDKTSGGFYIPTGGLSDSNSEVRYDWDISVDYEYYGHFTGWSGPTSAGIKVNTQMPDKAPAAYVQSDIDYLRLNRNKPFETVFNVVSDGSWYTIPFYIKQTDGGITLDVRLGVPEALELIYGSREYDDVFRYWKQSLTVKKKDNAELQDRLIFGLAFYPYRLWETAEDLTFKDVVFTVFDFVQPAAAATALTMSKNPAKDTISGCLPPEFIMSIINMEVFNALRTAVKEEFEHHKTWQEWNPGCAAPPLPDKGCRIIIRPHYRTEYTLRWADAYGFYLKYWYLCYEKWNTPLNQSKVISAEINV